MADGSAANGERVNPEVIRVEQVSKAFGATQALSAVDISLMSGEVHAFVGENGAGKSTLGKVIAGLYTADSGHLIVDGRPVNRWDVGRAQRAGIVLIAQELALVPDLSVEQNVFLGLESTRSGFLKRDLTERFADLEESVGFGLDPKRKVRALPIADQQKVEILRAIARRARVIIMDEPTSSLTHREIQTLHELIRGLRATGCAIVYVSHFLDDVLEVADRITIMRDGRIIRTADAEGQTKESLVEGMLGRKLDVTFPPRQDPSPSNSAEPRLELVDIATPNGVRGVSLTVSAGEIVGLLGLVGSGRTEIGRAIVGLDPITRGVVRDRGVARTWSGIGRAVKSGIGYVPEDRRQQGLVLQRSFRENVSLMHQELFSTLGFMSGAKERTRVAELARDLDVRPMNTELPLAGFSGGNQQKALFAKNLTRKPGLLVLDEPTRGVDVGAKVRIYKLIVDLAHEGISILLISSEHEEVLALSHRAYLVSNGSTLDEIDPAVTSIDDVIQRLFDVAA